MKAPLLFLLFLTGLFMQLSSTLLRAEGDFFPYHKGSYWLYDGTVSFVKDGQKAQQPIKGWRSEVIDVASGNRFKAALLQGHPGDLMFYGDNTKPTLHLLVLTDGGEFHDITGDEARPTFEKCRDSGKLPKEASGADSLLFKTSMKARDQFGGEPHRKDDRYCWVVENVEKNVLLSLIRGVNPARSFASYHLTYRSSPDDTEYEFIPGVGIASYAYHHHGTPGDCEMTLVEVGAGSNNGVALELPPAVYWKDVSTREVSAAEFASMSSANLRWLRNEIFARHGLIFHAADLKAHFESLDWYRPTVADVGEKDLPRVELVNLNRIKAEEKRRKK